MPVDFTHVTVASPLVPLDEMKRHLRITDTAQDVDVSALSDAAQAAILAYLTTAADPAWMPGNTPGPVKQAIKLLTTNYFEHRGDDMNPSTSGANPDDACWAAIGRLLALYRDPTLG
jgi:Phage gp6-like head-tail connector protein